MDNLFGSKKVRDISAGGSAKQILSGINLFEPTVSHDRDPIRQRDAVGYIMRHINRCQPVFLMEFQNFAAHSQPVGRIDVAQRLVHEKNLRRRCHGPSYGNPLLLSAGKLHRLAPEKTFFYAYPPSKGTEQLADFIMGPFTHFQRQRQIAVPAFIKDCHVRPQGEILKDHLHVASADGDVIDRHSADQDGAGVRYFKAGDKSKGCGLTTAALADDYEKLTAMDVEVGMVNR